jgi:hypothetical protein
MKLPWSPKLPVIDVSGFNLEKPDAHPWMTFWPKTEQENEALEKALDVDANLLRAAKEFGRHSRKVANYDKNSIEYFSRLQTIGVTPSGNLVVLEIQTWIVEGYPSY